MFSRAGRWEQPWEVVSNIHEAQFLLVASENAEELTRWYDYRYSFGPEHLIAYSAQPFKEARWHLRSPSGKQAPSPLEFTLLLKEIAKNLATLTLNPGTQRQRHESIPAPKVQFNWRERLKVLIVGSVGSGKTTAISTLCQGNAISTEAVPSDQAQLRKKSTTVAMDFGSIGIEDETQLHIYGAPGQRRFDFMSEILIKNALGIVILISNESSDSLNELNYYLNTHKEFLKHNRAVIGVTHNDINPNPSIGEYDRFIKGRGESWPVLKVDARKHEDMKKLVMSLLTSTLKHG